MTYKVSLLKLKGLDRAKPVGKCGDKIKSRNFPPAI